MSWAMQCSRAEAARLTFTNKTKTVIYPICMYIYVCTYICIPICIDKNKCTHVYMYMMSWAMQCSRAEAARLTFTNKTKTVIHPICIYIYVCTYKTKTVIHPICIYIYVCTYICIQICIDEKIYTHVYMYMMSWAMQCSSAEASRLT